MLCEDKVKWFIATIPTNDVIRARVEALTNTNIILRLLSNTLEFPSPGLVHVSRF